MAKLEVKPPAVPTEEYVLTLTPEEAKTILALVGSVTGSSNHSRRGYADRVWHALRTKLITSKTDLEYDSIFFRDQPGLNVYDEQ